ncbi:MAG: ABC transporter ATP-binding protein [Desulforegulaceae bacterium]|nr:ABC transporter ATP-binding protein [Desulforegulaceae bacterium]
MIELNNVTYSYPFQSQAAVCGISLKVEAGEAVLITGESGCGKSTLVRLINGLCPNFFQGKLNGEIFYNGQPGKSKSLREISSMVGTVFQDPELQFFALNVADELAFAHEWQDKSCHEINKIVEQTALRFGITDILSSSIHDLSEGQKQKVALGTVLSMKPGIVVLDEPSANLDPESTEELADIIQTLKKKGIAVVIADHRLYWLKNTVNKVIVMDQGKIAVKGDFSILSDQKMLDKYGLRRHKIEDLRHSLACVPENGAIKVKDLTFMYKKGPVLFDKISFCLPNGVTGIIGNNGTGKTTLARLLTGLNRMKEGSISVNGKTVSPKQMLKRSGLVLQNTDHQLHMNSVIQELAAAAGELSPKNPCSKNLMNILDQFGLKDLADRHPQSLSGGEKQRLVIACGLAKNPDVLILDEPTSGLDGRNMKRIANMIRQAAKNGVSVIVITHDLELLAEACDFALRLPVLNTSDNWIIEKEKIKNAS